MNNQIKSKLLLFNNSLNKLARLVLKISTFIILISLLLSFWNSSFFYIGIYAIIWGIFPALVVLAIVNVLMKWFEKNR